MSFGHSFRDFIALGTLAWCVYKSCKGAPEAFGNISLEVLSLHTLLKEAEEAVFAHPLPPDQRERLKAVGDECYYVLTDLDNLYKKYQSLGTKDKRAWYRMRWGSEDSVELRARLVSNTALLMAWMSISQATVHKRLDDFLREFTEGKREGSVIPTRTTDSTDDKQVWHTIRKELGAIGIPDPAFDANKDFIFEWFLNAIRNGAFEGRSWDDSPAAEPYEDSSDEALRDANSTSRDQLVSNAQQSEAPVAMSSSGIASQGKPESADDFPIAEPREGLSDGVLRDVNSGSRKQFAPQAQQSEVPIQQAATSSPRMAFPSQTAIGTTPPVTLSQRVAASKAHIPRVAALIALVSRPHKSLITAVRKGNPSKVCKILNDQKKAVLLDRTFLDWALREMAKQGYEWVVQLLLEKGANVNTAARGEDTALMGASRNGHEQVVRLLLENGADLNAAGDHDTALTFASRNGHEQIARLLLENGAHVNAFGEHGYTALVCASQNGYKQVVQLLLEKGADLNPTGEYGDNALVSASRNGHEQIVRLLLEKGPAIDTARRHGATALVSASQNGHEQIVRLLLEEGTDPDTTGWGDDTALVCASQKGHKQIVRLLLEKGADINDTRGGDTALVGAARNGHEQVVQLLLEEGAVVNAVGEFGFTAMRAASRKGYENIERLLIEYGAQPISLISGSYSDD